MKKQLKLAVVAAILAVTASASFATDFDTTTLPLADMIADDLGSYQTLGLAEMNVAYGSSTSVQNVALIAQSGDNNIGYISQEGASNFAVITQTRATAGDANVAYVSQSGNFNRANVNQR